MVKGSIRIDFFASPIRTIDVVPHPPEPSSVAMTNHIRMLPNGDMPTCQLNTRTAGHSLPADADTQARRPMEVPRMRKALELEQRLNRQGKAILELLFLIALPVILASFLSLETSNLVIFPFALLIIGRCVFLFRSSQMTIQQDIHQKSKESVFGRYLIFTSMSLGAVYILREKIILPQWLVNGEPIWFLALHVVIQEIIFRTYLINRLKLLRMRKAATALSSALVFASVHLLLPNAGLVFALTFVAGLVWSYLYLTKPSLVLVTTSHFLINLALNMLY